LISCRHFSSTATCKNVHHNGNKEYCMAQLSQLCISFMHSLMYAFP